MLNHLSLYPNLVSVRKSVCTQQELAAEIGISQQEISRYERGAIKAPVNYIVDVASVCQVSVDYILGLSPETENGLTEDETELLSICRKLSEKNRIRLIERAHSLMEDQTEE